MRWVLTILFITCACKLHAQDNIITTIAGDSTSGYCGDGSAATNACFNVSICLRLDERGNIYLSDFNNNRIRKIDAMTGIITTYAGTDIGGYNGDNIPATNAELNNPAGICIDSIGNIYFVEESNNRVRKVTAATGIITTVAGSTYPLGDCEYAGDGGAATNAKLCDPGGVCIDHHGNIYIAEGGNNVVRRVDAVTGIITTFAGKKGLTGYSGDGGSATDALFAEPASMFCDSADNVFICDEYNNAIRKVEITTNIITTICGNGTAGCTGDNGLASAATLNVPCGIFIDQENNKFIACPGDGTVRRIDGKTNVITKIAGNGTQGFSGDGGPATDAEMDASEVSVDAYGHVYIADGDNNRVREVFNPATVKVPVVNAVTTLKVYPNPVVDVLIVRYSICTDADIQVLDITGREVQNKVLMAAKGEDELDVHMLTPGLYIYRVTQGNMLISTGKIIKE